MRPKVDEMTPEQIQLRIDHPQIGAWELISQQPAVAEMEVFLGEPLLGRWSNDLAELIPQKELDAMEEIENLTPQQYEKWLTRNRWDFKQGLPVWLL